ncbi:hypothetical protein WH96_20675 [Kiloniella spongiae]|uniref:Uncharacterized protein n=1 Tax=Kiloniella spongiae TaxID=1489064 RepID=A0A0H2MDW6_9PROT|nr:hypothetical protein [Kiloniella spongiae]KLN58872.1 hypothetical protein WH96_20675 [Kiloniella spongiae]
MANKVYMLLHTRVSDRGNSQKLIGIYDTEQAVEQSLKLVSDQKGFMNAPEGFHVQEFVINQIINDDGEVLI